MDVDTASKIALAVLGVLAAWLQLRSGRKGPRDTIKNDAELLALLPKDSKAVDLLTQHIDRRVAQLIENETQLRRDWQGVGIAIFLFFFGSLLGGVGLNAGGWWNLMWLPGGVLILTGIGGFFTSIVRRKRDDRGNIIPTPKAPTRVEPEASPDAVQHESTATDTTRADNDA